MNVLIEGWFSISCHQPEGELLWQKNSHECADRRLVQHILSSTEGELLWQKLKETR
jgi:hypothetical protein